MITCIVDSNARVFEDMATKQAAILVLADGTCYRGYAFGASGTAIGEVVFNTGMTGYQEVMTDPSYRGQIVTFTCPELGNTGKWRSLGAMSSDISLVIYFSQLR